MQILDAAAVAAALPYAELVDTLEEAFRRGATVPRRAHRALDLPGESQGSHFRGQKPRPQDSSHFSRKKGG